MADVGVEELRHRSEISIYDMGVVADLGTAEPGSVLLAVDIGVVLRLRLTAAPLPFATGAIFARNGTHCTRDAVLDSHLSSVLYVAM